MQNLLQDMRYAVRMLVKSPGFTGVAALTLALGIGATTVIFSVIDGVLLKPLRFPQAEQVVSISQTSPASGFPRYGVSEGQFFTLQAEAQSLRAAASYHTLATTLTGQGEPERIRIAHVSAGMLSVMGLAPLLGRDIVAEQTQPQRNTVVLLSHGAWKRRFGGDPNVIGQTLRLDDRPLTIIGVLPSEAELPEDLSSADKVEVWQAELFDPANPSRWGSHYLNCLARVKDGIAAAQAGAEVVSLFRRLRQEHPVSGTRDPSHAVIVRSLQDDLAADSRAGLLMLLGAVAFLLLIACANVANLLLSRGTTREKELAIRAALGAGRRRLVTQLLAETLLLALLGGAAGCLLAWWGLDLLSAARPGNLPRLDSVRLDARVLLFALATSALSSLLFGIAPALQMTRVNLSHALRRESGGSASRARNRTQRVLVAGEIALAVILLAGAGLLGRSLFAMLKIDPGFRVENVLTLRVGLPASKYAEGKVAYLKFEEMEARLRALPGVIAAGAVNATPLAGLGGDTVFDIEGGRSFRDDQASVAAESVLHLGFRIASPGYFETLGIRLQSGRTFTDADHAAAPPVTVINETMARRFWPGQNPLGQRIRLYSSPTQAGPWMEIVGVTGDTRIRALTEESKQEIVMPFAQRPGRGTALVIRTAADAEGLLPRVREEVRSLEADAVIANVTTMEQVLNGTVAQPRLNLSLLAMFSGLALLMAVVGVYGVMSYAVSQRTREIGIRMALGARSGDVVRLVLREGSQMTLAGVAAGTLGALALTRFIQGLLFGISPTDPLTFAGVALLLAAVAQLACWIPARRATRVDPLVALRYE